MKPGYTYCGNELELFSRATHWKKYVAAVITKYVSGDVAEAGAGTGNFTPFLQSGRVNSWTYIEPDAAFRATIQHKITSRLLPSGVLYEKLSELPAGACFDTILYLDVLEHIADDKAEIQVMAEHLKPGGYMVILSPAYAFLYSRFDKEIGHFRRYTKKQLTSLFNQQQGMVWCKYLDTAGFFTSLANRWLLKQAYPTQQQITLWDTFLVPVSIITDKLLFHSFGRSVLLVWRKNN